jgi:hypothetical protein
MFLFFHKNFGTKPKLFDVFQLFVSKSKTLLYNPNNFRSERERFGSIMNFVSKTNLFDFLGTLVGKRKQTIFKKRWFDFTKRMISIWILSWSGCYYFVRA